LILLARPLLVELRPPRDAAAQDARRLVDRLHLGQEAAGEELGERARVDLG
jgi:hypothetical protein